MIAQAAGRRCARNGPMSREPPPPSPPAMTHRSSPARHPRMPRARALAAITALGVAIALPATAPRAQPVAGRGALLYDTHCIGCHTTQAHWRDRRLVTDWASRFGAGRTCSAWAGARTTSRRWPATSMPASTGCARPATEAPRQAPSGRALPRATDAPFQFTARASGRDRPIRPPARPAARAGRAAGRAPCPPSRAAAPPAAPPPAPARGRAAAGGRPCRG